MNLISSLKFLLLFLLRSSTILLDIERKTPTGGGLFILAAARRMRWGRESEKVLYSVVDIHKYSGAKRCGVSEKNSIRVRETLRNLWSGLEKFRLKKN